MKTKLTKMLLSTLVLLISATSPAEVLPQGEMLNTQNIYLESVQVKRATRFFALALETWNPGLNSHDIEQILDRNIQERGLLKGLVEPALTLIDVAYAADKARFGNLLGPMINEVAPKMAQELHGKFGLPIEDRQRSFDSIMALHNSEIKGAMQKILGDEFLKDDRVNPNIYSRGDFMDQAIAGDGSYAQFSVKEMLHDSDDYGTPRYREGDFGQPDKRNQFKQNPYGEDSNPRRRDEMILTPGRRNNEEPTRDFTGEGDYSVSTPKRGDDTEGKDKPRGLFSKMDLVSTMSNECLTRCAVDITIGMGLGILAFGKEPITMTIAAAVGGLQGVRSCQDHSSCKVQDPPKEPAPKGDSGTPSTPKDNGGSTGTPSTPKDDPKVPKENEPKTPPPKDDEGTTPPPEHDTDDEGDTGDDATNDGDDDQTDPEAGASEMKMQQSIRVTYNPDFVAKEPINFEKLLQERRERVSTPRVKKDW